MKPFEIPERIKSLTHDKNYEAAAIYLGKHIREMEKSLFCDYYKEHLEFLKIYRIQLLRNACLYDDAFAYACLETEKDDKNANARELKAKISELLALKNEDPLEENQNRDPWQDIAGMNDLKAVFEKDILFLFENRELYKRYDIPLPNGILLYGPPGCGKSFFASKLASMAGFKFISIKPSSLGNTYVHGTQLEIKRIFDDAAANRPAILFFDEIDAMVPSRNNSDVSFHYKSEVNEFLTQLDNCNQRGILVIGATNRMNSIDSAVLRPGRFDKKIFVGPPDYLARLEAFKLYMKNRPHDPIRWDYLAEITEGFTFADIAYIVNEAAREAMFMGKFVNTNFLGAAIQRSSKV